MKKTIVGGVLSGLLLPGAMAAATNPLVAPPAHPAATGPARSPSGDGGPAGQPAVPQRGPWAHPLPHPLPALPPGGIPAPFPASPRDTLTIARPLPARAGAPTAQAALERGGLAAVLAAPPHSGLTRTLPAAPRDALTAAPSLPARVSLPMAMSTVLRRGAPPVPYDAGGKATVMSASLAEGTKGAWPPVSQLSPPTTAQPISPRGGVVTIVSSSGNAASITYPDGMATTMVATAGEGATNVAFSLPTAGTTSVDPAVGKQIYEGRGAQAGAVAAVAIDSRSQQLNRMLLMNPRLLERDPLGAPVLRGEITLLLPEQARIPEALKDRGFTPLRETDVLGLHLVVLRTPRGLPLPAALELARELAPDAEADFNHLMTGSGRAAATQKANGQAAEARVDTEAREPVRVGLIDEAVGPAPDLVGVGVEARSCSAAPATGHGTAVAAVLARTLREAGRKPVLYTADLKCGHGSVDAIAMALQAMAAERVPVVNLSAVGPHNRVLATVVAKFLMRGHLLVAAVGNDGPAAPPLYPAAYPGVVAVTGVDGGGQVLMEAGTGDHVMFAAPGIAEVTAADGTSRTWRGTSFAAPVVAAALAARLAAPDLREAAAAVQGLASRAVDAGDAGRDRVYGLGVIGQRAANVAELR